MQAQTTYFESRPTSPKPDPRDVPQRVLVIDDSHLILRSTRDALESAGFVVETSDTVFVARLVNEFRPDLILMDVSVGRHYGTVAIEALRKHTHAREAIILLYSVQDAAKLLALTEASGADGFICKSDGLATAVRKVEAHCRNRAAAPLDA